MIPRKPTLRQKTAFQKTLANIAAGQPFEIGKIMLESGYTPATAHNPQKNLFEKSGWQELLAGLDDGKYLRRLDEIAMAEDKRASLQAIDQIFTLKDRKPAGKLKLQAWDERMRQLQEG